MTRASIRLKPGRCTRPACKRQREELRRLRDLRADVQWRVERALREALPFAAHATCLVSVGDERWERFVEAVIDAVRRQIGEDLTP